jgi:hypothetical protein
MSKSLLIKIAMSKSPNEMGNCPYASPLIAPLKRHIQAATSNLVVQKEIAFSLYQR